MQVQVPALDIDAMMFARFGSRVSDNGIRERRIVAHLIAHMEERGWKLHSVYDGFDLEPVETAKQAMELIFNLDEAGLRFYKGDRVRRHGGSSTHGVLLVMGNGADIISNYNYTKGDPDGFAADMEAFDPEVFA